MAAGCSATLTMGDPFTALPPSQKGGLSSAMDGNQGKQPSICQVLKAGGEGKRQDEHQPGPNSVPVGVW